MSAQSRPLEGLRVVEICGVFSPAALCGKMLADLGADVVMVDFGGELGVLRGSGDGDRDGREELSVRFVAGGKRVVRIDMEDMPKAERLLIDSLGSSDVALIDLEGLNFFQIFGIDRQSLERDFSSVVACCITPFGLSGPLASAPASELTLQALAGSMLANGYSDDPPVKAGIPVARCGSALLGCLAIAAALYERESSSLGQFIDLGQYDALLTLEGTIFPGYFLSGRPFARMGNRHAMASPWNAYRTSDGWIVMCTMGQSQWKSLADLIGLPELVEDSRFLDTELRVRNSGELDDYIQGWMGRYSSAEAASRLDSAGIPVGSILRIDEALGSDHVRFRKLYREIDGALMPTSPLRIGKVDGCTNENSAEISYSATAWERGSAGRWGVGGDNVAMVGKREPKQVGGPLGGVRVLELGSFTAGPLAGRLLGMLGAEVIKIEPPKGEGSRQLAQRIGGNGYLYYLNNTDKFGCSIALETPEGRGQFLGLADSADALISNLSSELMQGYKLGYEEVAGINPQLVYCSITGYGLMGPDGGRKAFDTVIQATSGIMTLTGFPEQPPLKVAMSVADVLGACLGAAGVAVGLLSRVKTRRGELVDASMQDVALWATQESWPDLVVDAVVPSRQGNRDFRCAPNGCYQSTDRDIVISVETQKQWMSLVEAMGRTDLGTDPRFATAAARRKNADELDRICSSWTSGLSSQELVRRCWSAGVPAAVPLELGEVAEADQTKDRRMMVTQVHPAHGPITVIGSPFKFSRNISEVRGLAPELGQDNKRYLDL